MVYAVYLNPTIDKTVYIDSLRVGGTNRVGKVLSQGGGKAVNLAVTLHQMDVPVTVCGFLYKGNSRLIRQSLIGISTSLWYSPGPLPEIPKGKWKSLIGISTSLW